MPIYEYQCKSCGHQLEAFQKVTEEPLVDCPNCNQRALEKLVSSTSFQLKGTGWYVTDFKDKGKPKPSKKEESAAETSSGNTEAKSTESKSTDSDSTKK